ncbi:hypothetical protein D3C81_1807070 [compost metagenome]
MGIAHQRLAKAFILDIAGKGNGLAAFAFDQGNDLLRVRLFDRQVVEGHISTFASEGNGYRAAYP